MSDCMVVLESAWENSLVVENHSEREDMTTFILEYTRKELHCQDKWDTFLMSMLAFSCKLSYTKNIM